MFATTNLTDDINLAVGIASFIFGIVALLLSIVFFIEAKKAEKNSAVTLEGISKTTTTLDRLSMRMINKLTSAIIEPSQREETLRALLMSASASGGLTSDSEPASGATKAQLEQFRVDNLIAAFYYCALTNISSRFHLPESIAETTDHEAVVRIVDGSASDFFVIQDWLNSTENIQTKINNSPVKALYDRTTPMINEIFNTREHYARRERESADPAQS